MKKAFTNLNFSVMKKLIILLLVFLPLLSYSQEHLGHTEKEIREMHSDKTFDIGYTDDGEKYIGAFMNYGTFYYYFNKETELSYFCMQAVDKIHYLNAQVEAYNKKYIIVSDTEWKAYLEGGVLLKVELEYHEKIKLYVFNYNAINLK